MISAVVNANFLAWKAAELSSALSQSAGWENATGSNEGCVYLDEARRLAADIQNTLDQVVAAIPAASKKAA